MSYGLKMLSEQVVTDHKCEQGFKNWGPKVRGLSKSTLGPSDFIRLQPGSLSKIRFVCV